MQIRVSDSEWTFIRRYLSAPPRKTSWQGRPRAPDRQVFEGILWVLSTGARWRDLPDCYPAKSTCHRRLQVWARDGSFLELHKALVRRGKRLHKLHFDEAYVDTTFIKGKRGAQWWLKAHAAGEINLLQSLSVVGVPSLWSSSQQTSKIRRPSSRHLSGLSIA